jgi:hypothetical protein
MMKGVKILWEMFRENHIFKILLFCGITILGGVLEVYLNNDISDVVVYIGVIGLLCYALGFCAMGALYMIIEVVEEYQINKDKDK